MATNRTSYFETFGTLAEAKAFIKGVHYIGDTDVTAKAPKRTKKGYVVEVVLEEAA